VIQTIHQRTIYHTPHPIAFVDSSINPTISFVMAW
jgi:hypothetical protein